MTTAQLATRNSQLATSSREDLDDDALIRAIVRYGPGDRELIESVQRGGDGSDIDVPADVWHELEILGRRLEAVGVFSE